VQITMVKKRLASGEPCEKCAQTEELLRRRGLWEKIDEVVWAIEGEDDSPGFVIARRHGIDVAPFFVIRDAGGEETVLTSPLRLIRQYFPAAPRTASKPSDEAEPRAENKAESKAEDAVAMAARFERADPIEILRWALGRYGDKCAIAFSGAEDVVLIDMATRIGLPFHVLTLDTGRLHAETYAFLDEVRRRYGVEIEILLPDDEALCDFVGRKGMNSFYQDGHRECCAIRKVAPLRRALRAYQAWTTGQRRDQSPATRAALPVIENDAVHASASGKLLKLNPLAAWSYEQVWAYIREHAVPYNPLHDADYPSIGCQPCTRAIGPNEHERDGRWWWEHGGTKECGLHVAGDGI